MPLTEQEMQRIAELVAERVLAALNGTMRPSYPPTGAPVGG
jgi:hypothetical protein